MGNVNDGVVGVVGVVGYRHDGVPVYGVDHSRDTCVAHDGTPVDLDSKVYVPCIHDRMVEDLHEWQRKLRRPGNGI